LGWVKDDAAHIAEKVAAFRPEVASQPALATPN
jgi:hypothetical protein